MKSRKQKDKGMQMSPQGVAALKKLKAVLPKIEALEKEAKAALDELWEAEGLDNDLRHAQLPSVRDAFESVEHEVEGVGGAVYEIGLTIEGLEHAFADGLEEIPLHELVRTSIWDYYWKHDKAPARLLLPRPLFRSYFPSGDAHLIRVYPDGRTGFVVELVAKDIEKVAIG